MKENISKLFLGLFSLCLIFGMFFREYTTQMKYGENYIFFQVQEEVIKAWKKGDVYYLFLPSYANKGNIVLAPFSKKICLIKDGKTIPVDKDLAMIKNGEKVEFCFSGSEEKYSFCVLQSENIPALFIETQSGSVEELKEDKERELSGTVVSVDNEGKRSRKSLVKTIRGRGNTSFAGYDKKPFSITLEAEESLLGLPKGKKYALISNASDPSLIRNDLARRMEVALELPYSHVGQFVDLYINGEYQGNYYLCDDIEIGMERVGIEDMESLMDALYQKTNYEAEELYETDTVKARKLEANPEDITGGYLMEREYVQRFRAEYEQIGSAFITKNQEHFIMKDPKYCSVEQINYIQEYVNETEKAIFSEDGRNPDTGKTYQEYLNVDTFVKKYLVEEVTKNYDAAVSSSFYYKDSDKNGGKLSAGPGWDYDMSLGNYVDWMEEFSADPTGISELAFHTYASDWYTNLYKKEDFYRRIKEDYNQYVKPFLQEFLTTGIFEYQEVLEASSEMNQIRWEEELQENIYYENRTRTFLELKEFVAARKSYLDEAWKIEKQITDAKEQTKAGKVFK